MSVLPNENRKFCSRRCYSISKRGKPVLSTDFLRSIDKSYMKTEKYSSSLKKETTPAYKRFANKVHRLSRKVFEENQELLNPLGKIRGINGTPGAYQLDHKMSIKNGFDLGLSEEFLSRLDNLQFIPWEENIKKGKN